MIEVLVRLHGGLLESFTAEGHAGGGIKGTNIVCAAATMLLRTAARTVRSQKGIESSAEAAVPGELCMTISGVSREKAQWLKGVTEVLLTGLRDLELEYPGEVKLITISK